MKYIDQSLYNQFIENMPIACVDIAIVANGKVLLVKRNDPPAKDKWWVPGGRVLKGETMKETAIRKAVEEIGMECHVGPIIHTAETIFPDGPNNIAVHSINSCFFLYPIDKNFEIKIDSHHTDFMWVDYIPIDVHPYVRDCLLKAGLEYASKDKFE